LQKAVEFTDNEHLHKPMYLCSFGRAHKASFARGGRLVDLEVAFSNILQAVQLTEPNHPERSVCLNALGNMQQTCFDCFGEPTNLEGAISDLQEAIALGDDIHKTAALYSPIYGSVSLADSYAAIALFLADLGIAH
jgi:hypothetical protein